MEVDKGKGKRSKRSPTSSSEGKLAQRLKREGVEVEMQEQRPRRKAAEGVSYAQQKPRTTERRMVTARRVPKVREFQEIAVVQQPIPQLERVQLPAEYYRPRPEKSSSSSRVSKKSSKSSNGSYQQIQLPIEDKLLEKLEELELGDYEFKDLPKLKRNQNFTDTYTKLLTIFKEKITNPVKKIRAEELLINTLYITISPDLKKWLETLQRTGVTKAKLNRLSSVVDEMSDIGLRLPETYDAIKSKFEKLFTVEDNQINTLLINNTKKRVEHTAVIDEGAKHKYYGDYYTKRLEDIYTMKEMFLKHKQDVMKLLDEYSSYIYEAFELIEHASEFVEKYNQAIQEYESSKKQQKGDLDDLISMFGNL